MSVNTKRAVEMNAQRADMMAIKEVSRPTYQLRALRRLQLDQRPAIAWLTGRPGAGKTSIAEVVDQTLAEQGRHVLVLDGDSLRRGLCRDLGFDEEDRLENMRRAAEVACLMAQGGLVVVVALVSPLRIGRERARAIAGDFPFLEIYVDTPLSVCEARDPKGLYARARRGEVPAFTGVSAPYEEPKQADLILRTDGLTIAASAAPLCEILLELSSSKI